MSLPSTLLSVYKRGDVTHPARIDSAGILEDCRIPPSYVIGGVGGGGGGGPSSVNGLRIQGNTANSADAVATDSVALGNNAIVASGATNGIAIGSETDTVLENTQVSASATEGIAMGHAAKTLFAAGLALGAGAQARVAGAVAIGEDAIADGGVGDIKSVAIGSGATATGNGSIAVGAGATSSADNAHVVGNSMTNSVANSVMLGGVTSSLVHFQPMLSVTQSGSISTTVTCNSTKGEITMASFLGAGNTAYFTVLCDQIKADNIVYTAFVNMIASTAPSTIMAYNYVPGVSFNLAVRNASGSSVTPVVRFSIL